MGLTGDDPSTGDNPSTSPHYHSATSDSALARARDGRPADEQAATSFADLFRHLGISNAADEPGRMYGGLNKVSMTLIESLLLGALGRGALAAGGDRVSNHNSGIGSGLGAGLGTLAGGVAGAALGSPTSNLGPLIGGLLGGSIGHRAGRYTEDKLSSSKVAEVLDISKIRARRLALIERMYGVKLSGWQLWGTDGHSTHEDRGPSPNPYEERLTVKSPPVGWGDEGPQRIRRAFDQIDGAVDTTNVGGGFGDPQPGPAALA